MKGEYNPFPQDEAAWHDNPCSPPVCKETEDMPSPSEKVHEGTPVGLSMFGMPGTEE